MRRPLVFLCASALACAASSLHAASTADLKQLSMQELLDVEVVSVSKRSERLLDAPASIYVITADDIRRSGATSLPEALRLAPGLLVARQDNVQYAVSARGFNNAIGNKLLVLIDGRTIYTPLFSGVFWDDQALPLEDIERIEVITGPGATLWGANAVNGVINVMTRAATDVRGTTVAGDVSGDERGLFLRQGMPLGANGALRLSGSLRDWDASELASGDAAMDGWRRRQAGFRADWSHGDDALTLQGDIHDGESQVRPGAGGFDFGRIQISGRNVLGRWQRGLSASSQLQVQAYYDHTQRDDVLYFQPRSDLFDLEVQHSLAAGRHSIVWGGGYRYSSDDARPGLLFMILPMRRDLHWENVFAQDEIGLGPAWRLTLGLKLERNDYTGWEYMPSMRLAFEPATHQLIWMGASRAVRAPARLDRGLYFPTAPPFVIAGGPDFVAEVADVFELGYRTQVAAQLTFSITGFLHLWDDLRSGTPLPVQLRNDNEGHVAGIESWAIWQAASFLKLQAGVTWLDEDIHPDAAHPDALGAEDGGLRNDPDYQWSLRSSIDLPWQLTFDAQLRGVAALPHPDVPSYQELDVRLGWQPRDAIEVAIGGRNLLHDRHGEFGAAATRVQIERNVYGRVTWRF